MLRTPGRLPRPDARPGRAGLLPRRRPARAASHLLAVALLLGAAPSLRAQDEAILNDDRIPRSQWAPQAALGSSGAVTVLWMDGRNGSGSFVDYDIYLTTIRDPKALAARLNRRVNDDGPGATQSAPDIASSPSGTFFCAWEDSRNGNPDIYGAALDSLGFALGPNVRVNDDAGITDQRAPKVAALGPDRYFVVWGDQRNGTSDIFGSIRSARGAPIGGNFAVSLDPVPGGSFQGTPAVAANAAGRILVVWLDSRATGTTFGDTLDVYGQWLDSSGNFLGGNFKINDATSPLRNASPSVAADPTLGFVVAWVDRRGSPLDPGDIYAQRFDAQGNPVGVNVRVNDDPPGRDQRSAKVVGGPGSALVCWEDVRDLLTQDPNVEAALVPYAGGAPGTNFQVNSSSPGRQGTPGGTSDGQGGYDLVWEDTRNGDTDIYGISIQPDGTRNGVDTQLNDDAAPFPQWRPRLGEGGGVYLASWLDGRNGGTDLYGQWIEASGARLGPNVQIWKQELVTSVPLDSDAAVDSSGIGLVVAAITRQDDPGEIRGFLAPTAGAGAGAAFWISDSLQSAQTSPSVAVGSGEFGIAWLDSREGSPRLYGQRILPDGSRDGVNHPVLTTEPLETVTDLDLSGDPLGGYWILYAEGATANQRLWLTHLGAALTQDRAAVPVSPELAGSRGSPRVACAPDGRVELAWVGLGPSGVGLVYHLAFDPSGNPLGTALGVGDPANTGAQGAPAIAVRGASCVVAWQGKQVTPDWSIWMQRFEGGAPASGLIRVDEDPGQGDQFDPGVGLDAAGHILVIWADGRSVSSGLDILARVFETAPTSVTEEPPPAPRPPPAPPRVLAAGPARPNPFSGVTRVPVEWPGPSAAPRAIVLNARGERVATLLRGAAPGPRFDLLWDGRDDRGRRVASGTYWLVLDGGGERRALRLVLLR